MNTDTTVTEIRTVGISARRACEILEITYRQIDYWLRTIHASGWDTMTPGSGSYRRLRSEDVMRLDMIARMLRAGLSLQIVRDFIETAEVGQPYVEEPQPGVELTARWRSVADIVEWHRVHTAMAS